MNLFRSHNSGTWFAGLVEELPGYDNSSPGVSDSGELKITYFDVLLQMKKCLKEDYKGVLAIR